MVKSKSLYHLALAGVLCAIGIIIPIFSPVKIRLDPMSFTLASHVAIFLAMFISPAWPFQSARRLAFWSAASPCRSSCVR